MNYGEWKAQNPNGTRAQWEAYKAQREAQTKAIRTANNRVGGDPSSVDRRVIPVAPAPRVTGSPLSAADIARQEVADIPADPRRRGPKRSDDSGTRLVLPWRPSDARQELIDLDDLEQWAIYQENTAKGADLVDADRRQNEADYLAALNALAGSGGEYNRLLGNTAAASADYLAGLRQDPYFDQELAMLADTSGLEADLLSFGDDFGGIAGMGASPAGNYLTGDVAAALSDLARDEEFADRALGIEQDFARGYGEATATMPEYIRALRELDAADAVALERAAAEDAYNKQLRNISDRIDEFTPITFEQFIEQREKAREQASVKSALEAQAGIDEAVQQFANDLNTNTALGNPNFAAEFIKDPQNRDVLEAISRGPSDPILDESLNAQERVALVRQRLSFIS